MWGHVPPGKFLIPVLLRSLFVPFWGETARVERPTANIVFEAKLNARTIKRVAPLRSEARKNYFIFS